MFHHRYSLGSRLLIKHTYKEGLTADLFRDPRRQALSSRSPSAVLQSASILQTGILTHVWCPSVYSCNQGNPLDRLALLAREACTPGSNRTVTIRARVLDSLCPHGTHRQQKEALQRKRPMCLNGSFSRRGRLQVWHTSRSIQRCSQET